MTASEVGAVPDDAWQEVRDVVRVWLDNTDAGRFTNEVTNAVLSVPAIADAFYAADESEVYVTALVLACSDGWSDGESAMQSYIETARTHVETAPPPLAKMTPQAAEDVVWLAKLAQSSSWPGEMADRVQRAADRVVREYGSDADRAALAALYSEDGTR